MSARTRTRRLAIAAFVLALLGAAGPAAATPLRFGIYPWGTAATTKPAAAQLPDNADASLAAVRGLAGGKPFVVRLYGEYNGRTDASIDALLNEAQWWSSNGIEVAPVLRYRATDSSKRPDWRVWLATQARRLAELPGVVSIQVGNEPNSHPRRAADGSYPGVVSAIAGGVPVVRRAVVKAGRKDIEVGFNWAADDDPRATDDLWKALGKKGGKAFRRAVGFVAVNVYPGTWSPPAATAAPDPAKVATTLRATLTALRKHHMPAAGLRRNVRLVIGETGYPTTPARSEAYQDAVLRAVVTTVEPMRATYRITDLYWFGLRDGNTASAQLENGYGLLRDDYSAKPAFETFRELVAGS